MHFLELEGITPARMQSFKHHTTVLQKVLRGEFKAGAIREIVADENVGAGIRIIYRTPPFPGGPISVLKGCDPGLIDSVKRALLDIDVAREEYRELVKDWDPEFRFGFIEARIEDYRKVDLMLE